MTTNSQIKTSSINIPLTISSPIKFTVNNSAPPVSLNAKNISYVSFGTQTTNKLNEQKDSISLARDSLQKIKQKKKDTAQIHSQNLPTNNIDSLHAQLSKLKEKIKELQEEAHKCKGNISNLSEQTSSQNKIVYEIFQLNLNKKK